MNNQVEIINSFPENESKYTVYEITVDSVTYFAARSEHGTWKVCAEKQVTAKTKQVPVAVDNKNCVIQLISLLERMVLANTTVWTGPLPIILGSTGSKPFSIRPSKK